MSKNETTLIRKYWKQFGGTLVEEFPIVKRSKDRGPRFIDAIIIPKGDNKILRWKEVSLKGKDIICVQAKGGRLGMYLMGQTLFSEQLLRPFEPNRIMSVALRRKDDSVLRPLLEQFPNMKVVVITSDTNACYRTYHYR